MAQLVRCRGAVSLAIFRRAQHHDWTGVIFGRPRRKGIELIQANRRSKNQYSRAFHAVEKPPDGAIRIVAKSRPNDLRGLHGLGIVYSRKSDRYWLNAALKSQENFHRYPGELVNLGGIGLR